MMRDALGLLPAQVAVGAITASVYHLSSNSGVLQFWEDVPVGSQAT